MSNSAKELYTRGKAVLEKEDYDKAREDLECSHRLDLSCPTWEERFQEFEAIFE